MTAQFHERLRYQGEDMSMCTEPLRDYFRLGGINPGFEKTCTALWRGYVGSWEIVGKRLYLIGLTGTLSGGAEATLESVFPGFADRVFAHWYTGTLRIPDGRQKQYVHMGWASRYERDVLIEVERGILKSTTVRYNSDADDDLEAYPPSPLELLESDKPIRPATEQRP